MALLNALRSALSAHSCTENPNIVAQWAFGPGWEYRDQQSLKNGWNILHPNAKRIEGWMSLDLAVNIIAVAARLEQVKNEAGIE